jgi:hypothetical protein
MRSYGTITRAAGFGGHTELAQGPPSSAVIQYEHKDRRVRLPYSMGTGTAEFCGHKV